MVTPLVKMGRSLIASYLVRALTGPSMIQPSRLLRHTGLKGSAKPTPRDDPHGREFRTLVTHDGRVTIRRVLAFEQESESEFLARTTLEHGGPGRSQLSAALWAPIINSSWGGASVGSFIELSLRASGLDLRSSRGSRSPVCGSRKRA